MQQQIATSKLYVNQPLLHFYHLQMITNTQVKCLITPQNIKRKFENIMLTGNRVFWKKNQGIIIAKVMRQFLKFVLKYFLSQNFSLPTAMINKMEKESTPRLSTDGNNIKGSSFK